MHGRIRVVRRARGFRAPHHVTRRVLSRFVPGRATCCFSAVFQVFHADLAEHL